MKAIPPAQLEELTAKILNGEKIDMQDEQVLQVLRALIEQRPQLVLSTTSKKRIDNVVQAKMRELLTQTHSSSNSFSFMNWSKPFSWIAGGVVVLLLGFFTVASVVATPLVLGSNVDTVTKSISYNAPLKISFSAWMDHAKTENAFKLEPALKGKLSWAGNTLLFTPNEPFTIGNHYTVTVSRDAATVFGKNLAQEYVVEFIIKGAPEVSFAAPNGITVGKEAKIVVLFNQPMTSLADLDSQRTDNIKLDIQPKTEGTIQWIDTSSLQFLPKNHLTFSSQYTVTIGKGSTALDGGQTEKDYQFQFQTIAPKVVTVEPAPASGLAGPTTPLKINFNQPVDLASLEQNVQVQPTTQFTYTYDDKDNNIVVLHPQGGLQLATNYKLVLGKNIRGKEGNFTLGADFAWEFSTVGIPTLASSEPMAKSTNADVYGVTLYFSNPMAKDGLAEKVHIAPEAKLTLSQDDSVDNTAFTFTGDLQYSTDYTLTIDQGVKDIYGQITKEPTIIKFRTKDRDPFVRIARKDYYNLFNGYQQPVYPLKTINIKKVDLYFCALSQAEFLKYTYQYSSDNPQNCGTKKSWSMNVPYEKNKIQTGYIDFQKELGSGLAPGIYFLSVTAPEIKDEWNKRDYVTFFVSRSALTLKVDKEKALVWATDLATGLPVAGMDITLVGQDAKTIATGKTDQNGLYQTPMNYDGAFFVTGKKGDDLAILSRYWSNGIASWDFGYGQDWRGGKPIFVYTYTDRPIYRPEQKVFFKGIVRLDNDASFTLPETKEISVIVNDPDFKEVYRQKLKVSSVGTFTGELLLDKNAPLGQYQISTDIGDANFAQYFFVEEYRKPEFKVEITPEKKAYADGDTLKATVTGSYYFGGALKEQPVNWSINSTDYYFSDYDGEWYSFADTGSFWYCFEGCSTSQSFITSGEGKLDNNGSFSLSTPLSLKDKKLNQLYTLEATIGDRSQQTVSNRASFVVGKGNYFVGIRTNEYSLSQGDKGSFKVLLLNLDKQPVANKNVMVGLYERKWNQVQKKNIDGEFYTEYEPQDTFLTKQDVRTDEHGNATGSLQFDRGGEMVLKAEVKDDAGHTMTSSTSVYVSDNTYISWFSGNDSRIDLIPDKQEYNVGETAKILVKSPFTNVKALLTYERRNILEKKIIDITSTSQIIEVPVTDKFVPNAYVSLVLMQGGGINKEKLQSDLKNVTDQLANLQNTPDLDPAILKQQQADLLQQKSSIEKLLALKDMPTKPAFRVGYTNLRVNNASKKITIQIQPDKQRYAPRETVQLSFRTTDFQNRTIPAELSVAVVDESVLALKTKEEDILKTFYGKKDLGVDTSSSMSIFTDTIDIKGRGAKGGGGGESPDRRSNFKDTAYFTADLTTNADGTGTVSFPLPDNLTTWRIIAVAVNKDTLVGSQTANILETKDLILRPVLPRFLRQGDEVEVAALVQNGQAQEDDVRTSLQLTGEQVELQSQPSLSMHVRPASEEKAAWKVKVGNTNQITFTMTAQGKQAKDEVQITLPVLPYATPEVVATFGETDSTRTESIRLSGNIAKDLGQVTITVYASLLTNVTQGIDALIRYPYGCSEQVMSALLSTVSAKNIFEKVGKTLPDVVIGTGSLFENEKLQTEKDPKKKLDLLTQIGLQKIYANQRADGGWGYWSNDSDSYIHLTAYVLFGLHELEQSGYSVDAGVVDRGLSFLKTYMTSHSLNAVVFKNGQPVETQNIDGSKANERAVALYVLSVFQKGDLGLTNHLYGLRDKLQHYAQGYLLLTLANLNQTDKADTILRELLSYLTEDVNARTAHIEEETNDLYSMNTDLRTTAIVLQGILRLDPKNPFVSKLVRYLVRNKTYVHYTNTQEITYTLLALRDYLTQYPLDQSGNTVKVSLNGEAVLNELLDSDQSPEKSVTKNIADVLNQNAEVTFENVTKKSTFFYDIVTTYFLPILEIAPRNNGLTVQREYFSLDDTAAQKPLKSAKVGGVLKGKLTIIVPKDRNLVVIESHLPAGLEAVNFNLETSQQNLANEVNQNQNDVWGEEYWKSGLWRFNHVEMRDDRVVLFANYLPAGVYEYEYVARVTSKGVFANPPAIGYEMYFPEIFGRSRGEIFTATE